MGKVIAKRFIFMIPVVLAVTFIIFMLRFISAGDAARVLAEKKYEHPSPEQVEEVRHEEGLDQPVLVQYGKWLDQALHGDFGKSYSTRKPAFEELKRYFPQTVICPLSSRQVKYLKVSDKNTYISFWSVGIFMHTISLYIF